MSEDKTQKPNTEKPSKLKDIDPKRIIFTVPDNKGEKVKFNQQQQQDIRFVSYKHSNGREGQLKMRTNWMKQESYTFAPLKRPGKSGKGVESDEKRLFMKVRLSPNDPNCAEYEHVMNKIDKRIEEQKTEIIGKNSSKRDYKYSKIIRIPQEKDEDEVVEEPKEKGEDYVDYPNLNWSKITFKINENKEIITKCFLVTFYMSDDGKYTDENGNVVDKPVIKKREQLDVKKTSDLEHYLGIGSYVRYSFIFNKLWIDKLKGKDEVHRFGLGIQSDYIELTKKTVVFESKSNEEGCLDSDGEQPVKVSDIKNKKAQKEDKKKETKEKSESEGDESSNDSDGSNVSDNNDKTVVKKEEKKEDKSGNESDDDKSESESEDEVKPPPKKGNKNKKGKK